MGSGAHHAQEAFKAAGWSCCSAEPGCSKCIKAHLRGRRFRHLMPLAAHAGAVVPEAGQSATQGIGKHLSRHRNPCHRILPVNCGATIIWHTAWMPEQYDLTLLHPDDKLGRDIAIMRTEIEELHAKLARMPAVITRAALGIIFSTAIITTLLGWWFLI